MIERCPATRAEPRTFYVRSIEDQYRDRPDDDQRAGRGVQGNSLSRYLDIFAETGVVVDMISQSAPHGTTIDFSFTASGSDLRW